MLRSLWLSGCQLVRVEIGCGSLTRIWIFRKSKPFRPSCLPIVDQPEGQYLPGTVEDIYYLLFRKTYTRKGELQIGIEPKGGTQVTLP